MTRLHYFAGPRSSELRITWNFEGIRPSAASRSSPVVLFVVRRRIAVKVSAINTAWRLERGVQRMARLEVLNVSDHRHLRLRAESGGGPHFAQIVAGEFPAAAALCPVLFAKNAETGRFYAGAMLGFRPDEPLLAELGDVFRPLDLQRQAFFISGEHVAIDREHPRISETEGKPLFDEDGEPSDSLRRIQRALGLLKSGVEETEVFIRALLGFKLIEPIDISLRFDDGEALSLQGLYTVSLDALRDLDDSAALELFRSGHLQLAYCMIGSLQQISVLADRRNRRLSA
ncbi:SapC family protein [Sphingomonas sp. DT-204]|uniref:SapC family protein n=1 Tax=Sphingomonas sp. DT-204 TaxID=3396166 RepID=UPI003F1C6B7F